MGEKNLFISHVLIIKICSQIFFFSAQKDPFNTKLKITSLQRRSQAWTKICSNKQNARRLGGCFRQPQYFPACAVTTALAKYRQLCSNGNCQAPVVMHCFCDHKTQRMELLFILALCNTNISDQWGLHVWSRVAHSSIVV